MTSIWNKGCVRPKKEGQLLCQQGERHRDQPPEQKRFHQAHSFQVER